MPNNLSQEPNLPATTPHLGSDATPSAGNAPPPSPPGTHHSGPELRNLRYIDASNNQNCNNVSITDNRADNSVDNSVTNINLNYQPRSSERGKGLWQKIHFMVPYSRNEGFIGTSQTLVWLEGKFKGRRANHHRVALWGMGGVGKTQDVLECVYHYQTSQQLSVFWIHAGSQLRFEKDYRKLAGLVGLLASGDVKQDDVKQDDVKQDIRPVVKSWLEGPESGDWVLVLDNADNELDFFKSADIEATGDNGLADFIPHGSKGTVIITTRSRDVAGQLVDACNILDKTTMDSTQARQLFTQNYPKATEYTGNEDNSISLLLEALQYLPLAIAQVAAYLYQNTLLLPSEYLNLFRTTKEGQKELLSKSFSDIRREYQSETVLATFSISFRQLREQSPLASLLLQLIACIDNQCIPHGLLAYSVENDDQIAQLRLNEALSKLINFGLLSTSRQGKSEQGKFYEMHSLVHVSINSFISTPEKDAAVKQMAKIFRRIFPRIWNKFYNPWALYLPHASILVSNIKESCQDKVYIYSIMASLFLLAGNTSMAEEHAEQAVKLGTDILGPKHPDTLTAIESLSAAYWHQRRLEKAEERGIQVMEGRKIVFGPEHPDTLTAIANLVSIYTDQGRLKEAEELGVQVVEARMIVLGPKHPDTFRAIGSLASIYWNQGHLKEAEELEIKVMEAQKGALGPEHPHTLIAIGNLASTYKDQGRLKEAEELAVGVIEAQKRVLGPEHPHTLIAIGNLASIYRDQGHLKEAEELWIHVIEKRKSVLGSEHPDTLSAIGTLAATYRTQKRLKEAEELEIQVLEARKRVLGPKHPATLKAMGNLATTYWKQERLKDLEELLIPLIEARKRVIGSEHPDTLLAIENLAVAYMVQGRVKEAEELVPEIQAMAGFNPSGS